MAPKPKTTPAAPEIDPVNQEAIEQDEDARISEIFAELGQAEGDVTWEVSVYRITGPERLRYKQPFLFDCDIAEVGAIRHRLIEQYGNGNYRVKVIRNHQLYKVFDIGIELPVGKTVAAPDVSPKSDVALLIDSMRERDDRILEELRALRTTPPAPASSIKELVETMVALQSLQPKPQPPPDVLGVFRDVMELVKDMPTSGGGGGDRGWVGLIETVLQSPAIAGIAQALIPAAAGMMRPQPPALSPRTEPIGAPPATIAATAPQTPWAGAMTQAMNYLVARAGAGADPKIEADWVFDNVPPAAIEFLAAQPDALLTLANFDPRVRQNEQWFIALLDAMATTEDAETQPPPPGPANNGAKQPASVPRADP